MTIGKLIKDFRAQNNMSMDEFAKLSKLSKGYISMLEKNKNPKNQKEIIPSIETIKKISMIIDIPLSKLIDLLDDAQKIDLSSSDDTSKDRQANEFSKRLKKLRTERGLSQYELSRNIGVSKSSVNMYERSEREPSFETLEVIADFFNVDMDYLFGKSEIKNKWQAEHQAKPSPDDGLSDAEGEHMKKYRALPDEGKHRVDNVLDYEYNSIKKAQTKGEEA